MNDAKTLATELAALRADAESLDAAIDAAKEQR